MQSSLPQGNLKKCGGATASKPATYILHRNDTDMQRQQQVKTKTPRLSSVDDCAEKRQSSNAVHEGGSKMGGTTGMEGAKEIATSEISDYNMLSDLFIFSEIKELDNFVAIELGSPARVLTLFLRHCLHFAFQWLARPLVSRKRH